MIKNFPVVMEVKRAAEHSCGLNFCGKKKNPQAGRSTYGVLDEEETAHLKGGSLLYFSSDAACCTGCAVADAAKRNVSTI